MGWHEWIRSADVEPSIYAADFANLGAQVRTLLHAGARVFHVDIGDGHFVGPITIGPVVVKAVAPIVHEVGGAVDCHLMVSNPERHFRQVAEAGGDSVTFHVEATDEAVRKQSMTRYAQTVKRHAQQLGNKSKNAWRKTKQALLQC